MMMPDTLESRSAWLLLTHQLPPKPAYFRVKIWRRLQDLGAVAIKASVYALPSNDRDAGKISSGCCGRSSEGGGEATIFEARLVDGLTDQEVRALFDKARDADYDALAAEARALAEAVDARSGAVARPHSGVPDPARPAAAASRPGRRDRLLRRQRARCRRGAARRHRAPPCGRRPRTSMTARRNRCLPSRRNRAAGPG